MVTVVDSDRLPAPQRVVHDDSSGVLREFWNYRELFYFLAWRDVKVRYKQTIIGVAWAVLQPLLTMVVFTLLFGNLAGISTDGVPRPLFYFAALLPWTYVSTTVSASGMSLISNSQLLTKIYFPRLIMPTSAGLSGLLDFLIGTVILAVLMAWYRVPVGWSLLLWPVLVLQMTLLALGAGTFLAALNVKYRDVKYALPFVIQLWLFASPIIYPTSMVPERFQWILALNPLTGLVEAFRYSLLPGSPVHWDVLGISAVVTVAIAVVSVVYFRRTENAFADIV